MVDVPLPVLQAVLLGGYLVDVGSLLSWIFLDAKARGSDKADWWAMTAWFLVPALVYFVWSRRTLGQRATAPSHTERLLGTVGTGFVIAFLSAGVLSPPDPFTQIYYWIGSLPIGLVLGYLFVWRESGSNGRGSAKNA